VRMPRGEGQPPPRPWAAALRTRLGRRDLANAALGDPHCAILAAPR
jgi:hypothetical protein